MSSVIDSTIDTLNSQSVTKWLKRRAATDGRGNLQVYNNNYEWKTYLVAFYLRRKYGLVMRRPRKSTGDFLATIMEFLEENDFIEDVEEQPKEDLAFLDSSDDDDDEPVNDDLPSDWTPFEFTPTGYYLAKATYDELYHGDVAEVLADIPSFNGYLPKRIIRYSTPKKFMKLFKKTLLLHKRNIAAHITNDGYQAILAYFKDNAKSSLMRSHGAAIQDAFNRVTSA